MNNNASHFYTTAPGGVYPDGWAKFYFDVAQDLNPAERNLLSGGEVSQWTDTYCITQQCGASNGPPPYASALFPPSQDASFAKSIGGMIFPRTIVAATAFWHFNASVSPTDPAFVDAVWATNDMIVAAGGVTCPSRCECDQLTQCGAPIIPPTPPAAGQVLAVVDCALPAPVLQAFVLGADGVLTAAGGSVCVANPAGGSGNPTYPLKLAAAGDSTCVSWSRGPAGRLIDKASGGCLDVTTTGDSTGIYECGSGEGLYQLNQAFAIDAALGSVVSLKTGGGCLSAVAA